LDSHLFATTMHPKIRAALRRFQDVNLERRQVASGVSHRVKSAEWSFKESRWTKDRKVEAEPAAESRSSADTKPVAALLNHQGTGMKVSANQDLKLADSVDSRQLDVANMSPSESLSGKAPASSITVARTVEEVQMFSQSSTEQDHEWSSINDLEKCFESSLDISFSNFKLDVPTYSICLDELIDGLQCLSLEASISRANSVVLRMRGIHAATAAMSRDQAEDLAILTVMRALSSCTDKLAHRLFQVLASAVADAEAENDDVALKSKAMALDGKGDDEELTKACLPKNAPGHASAVDEEESGASKGLKRRASFSNMTASELGRIGGKAAAASMSSPARSSRASGAARARWAASPALRIEASPGSSAA